MFTVALIAGAVIVAPVERYRLMLKSFFLFFDGTEFFFFSGPWWSLRTEFQFYLLMAIFLASYSSRVLSALVSFSVFLLSAITFCVYKDLLPFEIGTRFIFMQSAIAYLPVFALGIFLARLNVMLKGKRLLSIRANWLGDFAIIFFVYLLCVTLDEVSRKGTREMEFSWFPHHYVEALCWAGILGTATLFGSNFNKILSAKIPVWFGRISYSFYLVHLPFIVYIGIPLKEKLRTETSNITLYIIVASVCFVATAFVAQLGYAFVERPFQRLKAKRQPTIISETID
jgi:peptidoglycan/LPS O-acetylase OafA/YrhL